MFSIFPAGLSTTSPAAQFHAFLQDAKTRSVSVGAAASEAT
jgi:hypothetical protein